MGLAERSLAHYPFIDLGHRDLLAGELFRSDDPYPLGRGFLLEHDQLVRISRVREPELAGIVHLRPLPAPGTKGTLRRGDLHSRFGGSLNLNLHFHCAVPDGVFVRDETGVLFVPARAPTDEEVHKVLLRIARKLRGLLLPKQPEDPIDALDAGYAESVQSMQMTGLADPPRPRRCSAFIEGFSLHAGVHLHANDREGLEHLLAYGARGPISLERLSTLPDGRICYRLKPPARWPLRAVLHAG